MGESGKAMDTLFAERLRGSVKHEEVYLIDYLTVSEAREGIDGYPTFYIRKEASLTGV